jgi:hypothetical protein
MRCKGHVRTRSHLEGSIVESYLLDESLTSIYMVKLVLTKKRNNNGLDVDLLNTTPFFHNIGRGLVGERSVTLDHKTWLQAHRYVLFNYDHIEPYLK